MTDTRIISKKATDLLKADHKAVISLFEEYEDLGEEDASEKQALFDLIKKDLTVHAQVEEEIFYPAVREADDDKAEELVKEALQEHRIVKTLIEELSDMRAEDDAFEAKMKVLCDNVEHHAEEEEKHIFPLFKKLSKERQREISSELSERTDEMSR